MFKIIKHFGIIVLSGHKRNIILPYVKSIHPAQMQNSKMRILLSNFVDFCSSINFIIAHILLYFTT